MPDVLPREYTSVVAGYSGDSIPADVLPVNLNPRSPITYQGSPSHGEFGGDEEMRMVRVPCGMLTMTANGTPNRSRNT